MTPVLAATLLTAGLAALAPGPDLRVAALEAQQRAASPGLLRVPTTVRNAGTRRAGASSTVFRLSRDRGLGGDLRLGSVDMASLRAGRSRTRTVELRVPTGLTAGDWFVLACADGRAEVRERREGNNCRATQEPVAVLRQIEPAIPPGPG